MLFSQCLGGYATAPTVDNMLYIHPDQIAPVGFGKDENILPYPPSSFVGYRLITEYYAYPEKFMFFDIEDMNKSLPTGVTNQLDIYLYFNTTDIDLENNLDRDNFALGCNPIINLFEHKADPIRLTTPRRVSNCPRCAKAKRVRGVLSWPSDLFEWWGRAQRVFAVLWIDSRNSMRMIERFGMPRVAMQN